jgi:predicted tellurium resistance membrane protein TerC
MLEHLLSVENLIALLTLTSLEIVLGIDNIIVIAILTGRLPAAQQPRARRLGLLGAMVMRIGLLLSITWIMQLKEELFTLLGHAFSGKDVIMLGGGLFLIAKSTHEIHLKMEGPEDHGASAKAAATIGAVVAQIMVFDIVFSLDSVITAVGMAREIAIMIAAVAAAVGVMMIFAGPISAFVERHPTIKVLALSFLLLIGVMLTAEGLGHHIEKGYIYFAMAFSLVVELINQRVRRVHEAPRQAPPLT